MLRRTALALPAPTLTALLVTALLATALLATACASPAGTPGAGGSTAATSPAAPGAAATTPSTAGPDGGDLSNTAPPRLRSPTAPPRTPTDLLPSDLIVGTITAGGSGPCYGLQTDDGRQFALYGDAGTELRRGAVVRVWFEPVSASCGTGIPVRIRKLEIVS